MWCKTIEYIKIVWYNLDNERRIDTMKLIKKWFKKTDDTRNRMVIPKLLVKKYGREFYLEWYEEDIIKIVPIKK